LSYVGTPHRNGRLAPPMSIRRWPEGVNAPDVLTSWVPAGQGGGMGGEGRGKDGTKVERSPKRSAGGARRAEGADGRPGFSAHDAEH